MANSSVSRVLSSHPDVSPQMRDRVLAAVREYGYTPNGLAQGLRRGLSMSAGFVTGDITNPLMAPIALAAGIRLAESGYTLLLANGEGRPDRDLSNLALLAQRQVDGLLLSLTDEEDERTADEVRRFGRPAVLLDRDAGAPGASRVLFDHARGFRAATRHLLRLGHRRIGLIVGSPGVRHARERSAAVSAELAAAGLPGPQVRAGSLSRTQGEAMTRELMRGRTRPTAVICGGNQLLPGVISAVRGLGLRIPQDLSLITTDLTELAEFYRPPLAHVSRDAAAFGTAAAQALLSRLAGGPPETVLLPTDFVPAASCGPPARERA